MCIGLNDALVGAQVGEVLAGVFGKDFAYGDQGTPPLLMHLQDCLIPDAPVSPTKSWLVLSKHE